MADPWEVDNLVCEDLRLGVVDAFGQRPTKHQVRGFFRALGAAFRDGQEELAELNPSSNSSTRCSCNSGNS